MGAKSYTSSRNENVELVMKAAAFAADAHRAQKRKTSDEPYVNHVLRVGREAALAGLSANAVAGAILHDVVEDTPVTLEQLAESFPARVVELVRVLTQWWPDDAPTEVKSSEKPKYYARILSDPEAVELKLLDRADNLNDLARAVASERSWAERYLRRTKKRFGPLVRASRTPYARRKFRDSLSALKKALAWHSRDRRRGPEVGS